MTYILSQQHVHRHDRRQHLSFHLRALLFPQTKLCDRLQINRTRILERHIELPSTRPLILLSRSRRSRRIIRDDDPDFLGFEVGDWEFMRREQILPAVECARVERRLVRRFKFRGTSINDRHCQRQRQLWRTPILHPSLLLLSHKPNRRDINIIVINRLSHTICKPNLEEIGEDVDFLTENAEGRSRCKVGQDEGLGAEFCGIASILLRGDTSEFGLVEPSWESHCRKQDSLGGKGEGEGKDDDPSCIYPSDAASLCFRHASRLMCQFVLA